MASPFLLLPAMLLAININRFMWLLCREVCSAFLLCQQTKSLGNTGLSNCNKLVKKLKTKTSRIDREENGGGISLEKMTMRRNVAEENKQAISVRGGGNYPQKMTRRHIITLTFSNCKKQNNLLFFDNFFNKTLLFTGPPL